MKGRKGGGVVAILFYVPLREQGAERAVRVPRPLHHSKKLFDVLARHPPVDEGCEPREWPLVPHVEKSRRRWPEHGENARDRSLDRRDAAEGEGSGQEGHDLAIRRIRVAMG